MNVVAGHYWLAGGELAQPLRVTVTADPRGLVVADPQTGVHGFGERLAEAVVDFRVALVEHCDVLESCRPLSTGLAEQLRQLQQYPGR